MKRKRSSSFPGPDQKKYKPSSHSKLTLEEDIVSPWLKLYKHHKQINCGVSEDYRRFKAWVGVSPDVAEMIYCKYSNELYLPDRTRLLLVLNFLKNMPSQDEGASNFQISRPTYRKYLWETMAYLDKTMNEVRYIFFFFFFFYSSLMFVLDSCRPERPRSLTSQFTAVSVDQINS